MVRLNQTNFYYVTRQHIIVLINVIVRVQQPPVPYRAHVNYYPPPVLHVIVA
jgi:hypothetical protein